MLYKTTRVRDEWERLLLDDSLLIPVLRAADHHSFSLAGRGILVTSLWRSESEQRKICEKMKESYYVSVHQLWRGADLGVKAYAPVVVPEIVRRLNTQFDYGDARHTVAAVHVAGTAKHIHLQIPVTPSWGYDDRPREFPS